MRCRISIVLGFVGLLGACGRDGVIPTQATRNGGLSEFASTPFAYALSGGRLALSPQEDQAVRQLEAMYSGPNAPRFREMLTDPRTARVSIPRNPRADSILTSIYQHRMAALEARYNAQLVAAVAVDVPGDSPHRRPSLGAGGRHSLAPPKPATARCHRSSPGRDC